MTAEQTLTELARLAGTEAGQGLDDGRALWARALYGLDAGGPSQRVAQAVGSVHQALLSGILVQWLIDPGRAPSAGDLAAALQAIAQQLGADQAEGAGRPLPGRETDALQP